MRPRQFIINRDMAGRPLLDVLRIQLHLSRADALRVLRDRHVQLNDKTCRQPKRRVQLGQRVQALVAVTPAPEKMAKPEMPANAHAIGLRHADAQVVVVDKPAGLTTVRHADEAAEFGQRGRRFLPPTLVDLLPDVLAGREIKSKGRIRAVHRLDKETSGLIVLARTPEAERQLGRQFRAHGVGRRYLALVRGRAKDQRIESNLVRDRGDARRGSSGTTEGQRAVTNVRVVEELGAYTLIECQLETGRTHQVRIHLGESGTPLCGERIYDRPLHGTPPPDESGAKRPLLHAASLEFDHPTTGERVNWTAPLPRDMKALLQRLRKAKE